MYYVNSQCREVGKKFFGGSGWDLNPGQFDFWSNTLTTELLGPDGSRVQDTGIVRKGF